VAKDLPLWQQYLQANSRTEKQSTTNQDGLPLWQQYLNISGRQGDQGQGQGTRPYTGAYISDDKTEQEQLVQQNQGAYIAAKALGVENVAEKDKGFLTRALRTITWVPSAITQTIKEFAVDPFILVFQKAEQARAENMTPAQRARYKELFGKEPGVSDEEMEKAWNVKEYLNAINNREFLSQAKYIAPELETIKKEVPGGRVVAPVLGFGLDIIGAGGVSTGARTVGVLGRQKTAMTIENSVKDIFTKNAKKLVDETDEAFAMRAADFAGRAGVAQTTQGGSAAVARLFEREFGEAAGKAAFKELPRNVQGGLQVVFAGNTLANINAGGYTVRAMADALRIPGLQKVPLATEWGVKTLQNMKNTLRADAVKAPIIGGAVAQINKLLNNVGEQGATWQSFIKASVNKADDEEVLRAYAGFSEGVEAMRNLRNTRMEFIQSTKDFLTDLNRLKPKTFAGVAIKSGNAEAYDTARRLMQNPDEFNNFVPVTAADEIAYKVAQDYRSEYDRWHKLLTGAGFDIGYLDDYLPLMYAKNSKDRDAIAAVLTAGPKNIPGAGQRPDVERTKFMKNVIDPSTGAEKKIPMTQLEIKDFFIKQGRKDLADMIEADPEILLARYATNASRLLANKSFVDDMLRKNILLRSSLPQLDVPAGDIEDIVSRLNPTQIQRVTAAFAGTPGGLSKYIESVNDEFAMASRTGDKGAMKKAEAKVVALMESLVDARNIVARRASDAGKKLEVAESVEDTAALAKIQPTIDQLRKDHELLKFEIAKLRNINTPESNKLADELAARSNNGFEYLQVGGEIGTAYYLPKELAELHGERKLVESINRRLLLQSGGKGADLLENEIMESFDEFLQAWRIFATFGKFLGFVSRNAIGAIQNNVLFLNATGADHAVGAYITKTDTLLDRSLTPFANLSRADLSAKKLDSMVAKGKVKPEYEAMMRKDIEERGYVTTPTVAAVKRGMLKDTLEKKTMKGTDISYWDVYETSVQGKVFDQYTILPTMQGTRPDQDEAVGIMPVDPDRFVVRTDRIGEDRKPLQRLSEFGLNLGVTVPADIAGRSVRLEIPFFSLRYTRSANQRAEEFARTSAIAAGLRNYGKGEGGKKSAILGMRASQFDYSDLSEVERTIFRRIMPFYTWSKNNVPAQLRVLLNDPTRVQRNLAGWEAVRNVFADENGDAVIVPDYVSEMYGFVLDEDIRKQLLEDKPAWLQEMFKNPIGVATGGLSPTTELERWTAGPGGIATQAALSNPLSKAALQFLFEKDLWTDRDYRDVEAPGWYSKFAGLVDKASPGGAKLGIYIDDKTGKEMVNEKWLAQVRTLMPMVGTLEKNGLGVLDIFIESATGKPSNLSGLADSKSGTSILSSLTGLTTVAITPEVQSGQLKSDLRNKKDIIGRIAGNQGISEEKLNKLIRTLQAAQYTEEEILYAIEQARKNGELAADYLSATE